MKPFLVFTVAVLLLAGCGVFSTEGRYHLITAPDGKIYRLDSLGGAVHYISPDGMHPVSESVSVLRPGEFYEMEDGPKEAKYLKYMGNGQFEKSAFAVVKR